MHIGMHLCALLRSLLHLKYKRHESSKDYIIDSYSQCHCSILFSLGLSMKILPLPLLLEASIPSLFRPFAAFMAAYTHEKKGVTSSRLKEMTDRRGAINLYFCEEK